LPFHFRHSIAIIQECLEAERRIAINLLEKEMAELFEREEQVFMQDAILRDLGLFFTTMSSNLSLFLIPQNIFHHCL